MIQFQDIEQTLNTRGVYFDMNEYNFVLLTIFGEDNAIAYALSFLKDEYKKVKGTENEKDFFSKCAKNVANLEQQQHIIKLREEVQYRYKKQVQDSALKLDDIELTSSDVKKVLASFLRDRIDDPSSASVKELVDLLRMYQPYLPDDASATDFQRHFIQVHDPFNALCTKCGHEFDAYPTMDCICPHCHQIYRWSNEEQKYFPNVEHL